MAGMRAGYLKNLRKSADENERKMKPIYFPFTYISKPIAEAIHACFRKFVVYQPSCRKVPEKMQVLEKSGILDIRVPVQGDEDRLDALLKDYRAWVNLHGSGKAAFFKTQAGKIPFFDDCSISQIKADIKKKDQDQKSEDSLFNAKIFLHVAQEFDMQNWEVNRNILLFEEMEQDLIKNLKGDNELSHKKHALNKTLIDDTDYMTADRIKAWAHIMRHDREISGLFITGSKSVFDYLIDKAPEAKIAHRFDSIPVCKNRTEKIERWQDDLMQHLDNSAQNSWPVSIDSNIKAPVDKECDDKVSLTLYLVPEETPIEFFARCIKDKTTETEKTNENARFKNTLIGLIE